MSNPQLRALVENFVGQVEAVLRQNFQASIQSALSSLSVGGVAGAAVKRGPGRPPKSESAKQAGGKKLGKNGRRSPEEIQQTANKILDYVKRHPGARGEDIKKALGLSKPEWLVPINKLTESKALVMKGQKRAATYTAR